MATLAPATNATLSELAHVSRLSTIGEMASGFAHELNQPLCAIVNYTEACLRLLKQDRIAPAEIEEAMVEVARQAERAGVVIRRLREFVRKREALLVSADLNHLVREVVELTRTEAAHHKTRVELCLAPDLPPVNVDIIQIEQVIVSLVRNGLEAMSDTDVDQRRLTIETRPAGRGQIEVAVRDRGRGIPEAERDRVFEPFFSTKAAGLGLGLPIGRSIIEAHDGCLWLTPNDGPGVTLHFSLRTCRGDER